MILITISLFLDDEFKTPNLCYLLSVYLKSEIIHSNIKRSVFCILHFYLSNLFNTKVIIIFCIIFVFFLSGKEMKKVFRTNSHFVYDFSLDGNSVKKNNNTQHLISRVIYDFVFLSCTGLVFISFKKQKQSEKDEKNLLNLLWACFQARTQKTSLFAFTKIIFNDWTCELLCFNWKGSLFNVWKTRSEHKRRENLLFLLSIESIALPLGFSHWIQKNI